MSRERQSHEESRFDQAVTAVTRAYIRVINGETQGVGREFDAVIEFTNETDPLAIAQKNFPEFKQGIEAIEIIGKYASEARSTIPHLQEKINQIVSPIDSEEARRIIGDTLCARAPKIRHDRQHDLNQEFNELLIAMQVKGGIYAPNIKYVIKNLKVRQVVEVFLKGRVEIE